MNQKHEHIILKKKKRKIANQQAENKFNPNCVQIINKYHLPDSNSIHYLKLIMSGSCQGAVRRILVHYGKCVHF